MSIAVGKKVPDFQAQGTAGPFALSNLTNTGLVLFFYPKDNTPGCTNENRDFASLYERFQAAGYEVLGASRDSLRSHENFRAKFELPFHLLSDPDEILCESFAVMKLKNMYGRQVRGIERSTFLIGADRRLLREWRGLKVPGHAADVLAAAEAGTA
ncbi:MAG: peroxiredoxin [Burkholderiaceae bacterium]